MTPRGRLTAKQRVLRKWPKSICIFGVFRYTVSVAQGFMKRNIAIDKRAAKAKTKKIGTKWPFPTRSKAPAKKATKKAKRKSTTKGKKK